MTERLIPGVFADIGLDLSGAVWIAYETPARDGSDRRTRGAVSGALG